MLWSTKNPPSWVKCQHILSKTGKLVLWCFWLSFLRWKLRHSLNTTLRNPDRKTLRNRNIYKKHFWKFRGSICQAVEVMYIYTPTANTIGKQAGTCQGTILLSRKMTGQMTAERVSRGGRISHLLWANHSQGIFIRNPGGMLWHTWWDQGWVVHNREVVVELHWAQLLGMRQYSEAASIEAVQPYANQSQMWLGNKRRFAAICPPQLWNSGYASQKNLAKSYP